MLLRAIRESSTELPLLVEKVPAGFPSPAEGYIEQQLDVNDLLIKSPSSTFYIRLQGDSMIGDGLLPGDYLVVDRSLEVVPGKVVIASVDGAFTCKRLEERDGRYYLVPSNPKYPVMPITDEGAVFAVVSGVVRCMP